MIAKDVNVAGGQDQKNYFYGKILAAVSGTVFSTYLAINKLRKEEKKEQIEAELKQINDEYFANEEAIKNILSSKKNKKQKNAKTPKLKDKSKQLLNKYKLLENQLKSI